MVIGIEENGADRHPVPRPKGIPKYTQEQIANVVKKFIDPVFECSLDHMTDPNTGIEVAILSVPTGIPDIVMSKSGIVDGPITEHRVYVRKPGPQSEMPTKLAEWRALFDRCVKARQMDMLDAIRAIVIGAPPALESGPNSADALTAFREAALARWRHLIETTPADSGARMPHGYWTVTFSLEGITEKPSLRELLERIQKAEMAKLSGWPTFLVMSRQPFDPKAVNNGIETWIYEDGDRDGAHTDFWRIDPSGHGFMIRGYQEDYIDKVKSNEAFDITVPTWRIGEAILSVSRLASLFGEVNRVRFSVQYTGLSGRRLVALGQSRRWVTDRWLTHQDSYEACTVFDPRQAENTLPEIVHKLLAPLYETFSFFELTRQLVTEELTSMQHDRL